jgi:hypothetical protein
MGECKKPFAPSVIGRMIVYVPSGPVLFCVVVGNGPGAE